MLQGGGCGVFARARCPLNPRLPSPAAHALVSERKGAGPGACGGALVLSFEKVDGPLAAGEEAAPRPFRAPATVRRTVVVDVLGIRGLGEHLRPRLSLSLGQGARALVANERPAEPDDDDAAAAAAAAAAALPGAEDAAAEAASASALGGAPAPVANLKARKKNAPSCARERSAHPADLAVANLQRRTTTSCGGSASRTSRCRKTRSSSRACASP